MAIDSLPSSRALERLESEQRQRTPEVGRRAIAAVLKLFEGDFAGAVESFRDFHGALADEKSEYLLRWVIEDLKTLSGKYEDLSARLQAYMGTDWLSLLVDADRKARATRAQDRIRRIAQVLVASIREPIPPPDETEEVMGIAMELTDHDVVVLQSVSEAQWHYEHQEAPPLGVLKAPLVSQLPREQVLASFGKLQGLGLIIRAQDHSEQSGTNSYPSGGGFFVLEPGKAFLRAIAKGSHRATTGLP